MSKYEIMTVNINANIGIFSFNSPLKSEGHSQPGFFFTYKEWRMACTFSIRFSLNPQLFIECFVLNGD